MINTQQSHKATEQDRMDQMLKIIKLKGGTILQTYEFSVKIGKPLSWWQLNMMLDHGSRGMGKTHNAIMEVLAYIADQPNYVTWAGGLKVPAETNDVGEVTRWITTERGKQSWDDWDKELKERHMPDLSFVDLIGSVGAAQQGVKMYFHRIQEIIGFELNGAPVTYHQTRREVHFECNNHTLRILPFNFRKTQEMSHALFQEIMNSATFRGLPRSEFQATDLNIQL